TGVNDRGVRSSYEWLRANVGRWEYPHHVSRGRWPGSRLAPAEAINDQRRRTGSPVFDGPSGFMGRVIGISFSPRLTSTGTRSNWTPAFSASRPSTRTTLSPIRVVME